MAFAQGNGNGAGNGNDENATDDSDEENYDFWLKLNEGIDDLLKDLYPKVPVSERNKIAEKIYDKIEKVLEEEKIYTKG